MKKLVFICHGNTFRSQVAEAIFNHNPKEGWVASSYGIAVIEEKTQGLKLRESPFNIKILLDGMKKRGMDISEKYCKQLFSENLEDVDKVIIMIEDNFIPEWLIKRGYERWDIQNPEIHTKEFISNAINLLTDKIEELKNRL